MPQTDTTPVSASIASTGKGIRYIGRYCYAYSGEVLVNEDTQPLLNFQSGSGFIIASFSYGVDQNAALSGSKLIGFTIQFNGIKVFQVVGQSTSNYPMLDFDSNYKILIPPLTTVLIESETTNSANIPTYGMLTGRVYGAE